MPPVMRRAEASSHAIRTTNPSVWPQYPHNSLPTVPEQSDVRYEIRNDWNQQIAVRDGTKLLLDVYRPAWPGKRFPALCSFSPYTRQLQRESPPIGQNEAGISEFWVPRGYAHVIVDVRGSNGSEGSWDHWGPTEQDDMADIIEWVASQPWCDGNVGMMGCSYFAMTQNLAAEKKIPALKAIFPYDAMTDLYRDVYYRGGVPSDGWPRMWFSAVRFLNFPGGRNPNTEGMTEHFRTILSGKYPFDGEYYQERSAWPRLGEIGIPTYFGCHWEFYNLHLRGTTEGWLGTQPDIIKRMLIGPTPFPVRQYANYHHEALRWYDQFLKQMDTGVLEGDPIHLWIQGDDEWRDEREWPLARTRLTDFHLGGSGNEGTLSDTAPSGGELVLDHDPTHERARLGEPRLVYRTEQLSEPLEVTGPVQLDLTIASTAVDTDWIVILLDEDPDGTTHELTRGWLRSSHRAVDAARSLKNRPWHPHTHSDLLTPGEETELNIEVVPTSNVFAAGHRIRLELANIDSPVTNNGHNFMHDKRTLAIPAENTVLHGARKSRLSLPVIPR